MTSPGRAGLRGRSRADRPTRRSRRHGRPAAADRAPRAAVIGSRLMPKPVSTFSVGFPRPASLRLSGALFGLEVELVDLDVERHDLPVANDLHRHGRARRGARDDPDEFVVAHHRLAVELDDDVVDPRPAAFAGPVFVNRRHDRAALGRAARVLRSGPASSWFACTRTPMRPRTTLPVRSCGRRSRTVLIGIAKPTPRLLPL